MLGGDWWSRHTALSSAISLNSPPSCRAHGVSQLLLEVFLDCSNLHKYLPPPKLSADSLSFPPLRVSPTL